MPNQPGEQTHTHGTHSQNLPLRLVRLSLLTPRATMGISGRGHLRSGASAHWMQPPESGEPRAFLYGTRRGIEVVAPISIKCHLDLALRCGAAPIVLIVQALRAGTGVVIPETLGSNSWLIRQEWVAASGARRWSRW